MVERQARKRHPRSLLNLSLVDHLFQDKAVKLVRRGVDARWTYRGQIQTNQSGFNPPSGALFYRAHSHIDKWLPHREGDTRKYNYNDGLVGEVMFLVHDHLHLWSYRWIQALCPELGLGTAPVTKKNLEALTFCHLLTESVATVGVDYWFLATLDLNKELDLGTNFDCSTIHYEERLEAEYQKFCPKFTAQQPSYLKLLHKFYCSGEFPGFSKQDLARSPQLLKWLEHELDYGVNQRSYARAWLSYLSRDEIQLSPEQLKARLSTGAPWQKQLVGQLTELLWSKVKYGKPETPPKGVNSRAAWALPLNKPVDFRFANWNRLQRRRGLAKLNLNLGEPANFLFWFRQFVSQFDLNAVAPELLEIKLDLFHKGRRELCEHFFKKSRRIAVDPHEPEMLFLLN
jgi:hypothetical protein